MNSSKTFARCNENGGLNGGLNSGLNGSLNGDLNLNSRRGNVLPTSTASPRRNAIFSAVAALGLAGGLIISPSLASAAPGDTIDPDAPECNEYAAANFSVGIDRFEDDPSRIEIRIAYADVHVCDFTVWSAIAEPSAVVPIENAVVGLVSVAGATESAGYHLQTFDDHDLCDLEIRVAVEENLAVTYPFTDPGCETPIDGETPVDAPLQESPQVPSVGLPATGTDLTSVMFALGLITLGAGSVIALATRRREESSIL